MLINRARKNGRKLARWRKREGVSCYRVYDRDIPELPLTLDLYGDRLHGAAWARKRDEDGPEAVRALHEWLVGEVGQALGCAPEHVHLKGRARQRGKQQYDPVAKRRRRFEVTEAGLKFWVNLTDYLDTGLFLDHRTTRKMVGERSAGKDVLNLFAYTGSFSVHAAAGGAATTTTVDMSQTYCDWAHDNLRLNGFDNVHHQVIRDDVKAFLQRARHDGLQWDLVVCDPPTFSNSKRTDHAFDIGRDQAPLMQAIRAVLRPGGQLVFSTNFRKFRLSDETFRGYDVSEVSEQTVPEDFRDRRIHRCWWATVAGGHR
ncbi:MAG: class I SAM-dependent methyltransferase [Myxococcales bacterium]|nr:class I SAM-dependent methyltransferase [Myxococcales bacterium]